MNIDNFLSSTGADNLRLEDIQKLKLWNSTFPATLETPVHELVYRQCIKQSQAKAICAWDGEFSYEEMENLSSKLARQLISHGVTPKTFVPIYTEKSGWTTIGLLGVLKAGGASVLLDSNHPIGRLRSICDDTAATLVLTTHPSLERARALGRKTLVLESCCTESKEDPTSVSCHYSMNVSPSGPMCAVFTSGSTSEPKGAILSHAAFATSMSMVIERSNGQISSTSRVLQFSSYSFDAVYAETFLCLLAGGCLCVPSESERKGGLADFIDQQQVNWAMLTPSVARLLSPDRVQSLKSLVLVGEAVSQADLNQWQAHLQLMAGYGPAECTPLSTLQSDLNFSSPTNIGFALGVISWVVDPNNHHRLLPIGAEGELLLTGPAVGDGYLHKPEQTAAAFVDSPHWLAASQRGMKVYKTGDIVRYNSNGSLEYLGRKDRQVKVRGQRVDLGEIESNVRELLRAGSQQSVIAETVPVDGRSFSLCVFLGVPNPVAGNDCSHSDGLFLPPSPRFQDQTQQLISLLRQRLPPYMIPDHVLHLSHVPMTGSAKTDRRRLRDAAAQMLRQLVVPRHSHNMLLTGPRGILQRLWGQIFNLEPENIGLEDHWFDLGGNSLLAMKLVDQARGEGLELIFEDVFYHPILAELASVARPSRATPSVYRPFELLGKDELSREEILRVVQLKYPDLIGTIEDIYPCTFLQDGMLQQLMSLALNYTMRVTCDIPMGVNQDKLARAWQMVVDANPILRTCVIDRGNGVYLQVVTTASVPMEIHLSFPPPQTDIWGFGQPLVRLMQRERQMALLIHHAIYDAFSLPLIFQHLEKAYLYGTVTPQPLAPFMKWISTVDTDVDAFWKKTFAGLNFRVLPALPSLGYSPRAVARLECQIPFASRTLHGFTVDSCLRLALAIAVNATTDHADVVFWTIMNRRNAPIQGVTQIVGPLLGLFPARVHLDPRESFQASLSAIQAWSLQSVPFQCAELGYLAGLDPMIAMACQAQISLMVMPDPQAMWPPMFFNPRMEEDEILKWGLCFLATPTNGSIRLMACYDEGMVDTARVRIMLDHMTQVVHQIENNTMISVSDWIKEKKLG